MRLENVPWLHVTLTITSLWFFLTPAAKCLYECLGRESNPRTQDLVVAKFKHKKEGEHISKFLEDLGTLKGHHTQLHGRYLPYKLKGVPLSDSFEKQENVYLSLMSCSAHFSQNHKFGNMFPFFFMLKLSDDQALCTRVWFPP
jgi:hypothetical protein